MTYCTREAARHAVMTWHYSRTMPTGKLIRYGVWDDAERFVGAVIFGRGASGTLGQAYGLDATQWCELVRVALREHGAPVSQIVADALALLRRDNPGLRLVVSFADPARGHHGGIYQAGNWIYTGRSAPSAVYVDRAGRRWHERLVTNTGTVRQFGRLTRAVRKADVERVDVPGKHRYLYPLDRGMRRQLVHLAQPYPRAGEGSKASRGTAGAEGQVRPLPPARRSEGVSRG